MPRPTRSQALACITSDEPSSSNNEFGLPFSNETRRVHDLDRKLAALRPGFGTMAGMGLAGQDAVLVVARIEIAGRREPKRQEESPTAWTWNSCSPGGGPLI